jgi:hypothetical protein
MNTKMLMLGILLLAGLSFALPTPSWMTYTESRYSCNYYYNEQGYIDTGLLGIVYTYDPGIHYWAQSDMENDLQNMEGHVWGRGGMWDTGCDSPNAALFRTNMLAYNADSALYKSRFLAGLRAYITAVPINRTPVMADMQVAMEDYKFCLSDIGQCHLPR